MAPLLLPCPDEMRVPVMICHPIKFQRRFEPQVLARLLRFAGVGGLVFVVDFALVYILGKVLAPLLAVSVAYILAVCVHFTLNKWWVFGARTRCDTRELLSYSATAALCWGCTVLCVKATLGSFTHNLLVAKLAAIVPTMVLGFCLMRFFVFRQARLDRAEQPAP
jgi:putative flippase GtrA